MAFAFCWADILFQLDNQQNICFAGGPTESLLGRGIAELMGKPFTVFVAESNKVVAEELLSVAEKQSRMENATTHLPGATGPTGRLAFAGYLVTDLGDYYFLDVITAAHGRRSQDGKSYSWDTESGVYDADSFGGMATDQIKAAKVSGTDAELTFLRHGIPIQRIRPHGATKGFS